MHCQHCGESYTLEEVQYMSQAEGYCMLKVSCKKCKTPVWVNFFIENGRGKVKSRLNMNDLKLSSNEPISIDEMIDFHLKLSDFDGNFKAVFDSK
jgi:hypothetical protein